MLLLMTFLWDYIHANHDGKKRGKGKATLAYMQKGEGRRGRGSPVGREGDCYAKEEGWCEEKRGAENPMFPFHLAAQPSLLIPRRTKNFGSLRRCYVPPGVWKVAKKKVVSTAESMLRFFRKGLSGGENWATLTVPPT